MTTIVASAVRTLRRHPTLWLMRLLWLTLPWTVGGLIGRLVATSEPSLMRVCTVGAWLGWTVVLMGLMVRRPWGLTALRVIAPGPLLIAMAGVMASDTDPVTLIHACILVVVALLPELAGDIVDGISYGDERRIMLRVPRAVAAGGLPLTWAATAVGLAAGPLLLADGRWWGLPLTALGWLVAGQGLRAMHQLSRRWVVFVPNGFVVHDLMTTREPFLLRRQDIGHLGPAPPRDTNDESDVIDVAPGTAGAKIEARLDGEVEVVPLTRGVAQVRVAQAVLFAPTRPGLMLREAAARGIPT